MISAVAVLLVTGASAQAKKAAKGPGDCPVCHMSLSAKKDKMHSVKVYLPGGKTAYCCAGCKMPSSLTTKPAKKAAAKKPMAKKGGK